jgi:O-antigen ligase
MWRSSPWFGIGGGGFRHEYAAHVPREYADYLARSGKANVHNDGIQFLAEFGAVGWGSMAVAVGAMAAPLVRRRLRYVPVFFLSMVGLVGVMLHGVVDLPFRSPAILFTWVAVLAVLSVMVGNVGARRVHSRCGASNREDRHQA